jgi:hypothetical protein
MTLVVMSGVGGLLDGMALFGIGLIAGGCALLVAAVLGVRRAHGTRRRGADRAEPYDRNDRNDRNERYNRRNAADRYDRAERDEPVRRQRRRPRRPYEDRPGRNQRDWGAAPRIDRSALLAETTQLDQVPVNPQRRIPSAPPPARLGRPGTGPPARSVPPGNSPHERFGPPGNGAPVPSGRTGSPPANDRRIPPWQAITHEITQSPGPGRDSSR